MPMLSIDKLIRTLLAARKEQAELAALEKQTLAKLLTALKPLGLTLENGAAPTVEKWREKFAAPLTGKNTDGEKAIFCPKGCGRTFAHPLPLSRHLVATHGMKKKGATKK